MPKSLSANSTPIEFLSFISKKSNLEKRIINYLMRHNECTRNNLIKEFNFNAEMIDSCLMSLEKDGIIVCEKHHNIKVFSLDIYKKLDLFPQLFPDGPVIPLVYQFNLLSDTKRITAFKKAIDSAVNNNDIVLDIGAGTGVLSLVAAKKAKHVYAVEVDPGVALYCKYFTKNSKYSDKITVINKNVLNWKMPVKPDLVICEMLDTALIAELQVPVMNYINNNLLKVTTKIIPIYSKTSIQLIYKDFKFLSFNFSLPHFEAYGSRSTKINLSKEIVFHEVYYNAYNSEVVDKRIEIIANKSGYVNALKLSTVSNLFEDINAGRTGWLTPDLVLPIDIIKVNKGEKIVINVYYKLGGGLSNLKYNCKKEG